MKIRIEQRLPSLSEYKELRTSVGWPVMADGLILKGLSNSLFCVCAIIENKSVGMGRVIGDGAIYFHVQDVIVNPDFQGKKIGHMIMDKLIAFIKENGGAESNVGLMCSKGREDFYKAWGFIERPNDRFGAGMIQILGEH
jgi:predicted GNAT family N-acyltransferase